jgi:hypothetical protein
MEENKVNERQKDLVMFLAGGDNAINKTQNTLSQVIFEGGKKIYIICSILI